MKLNEKIYLARKKKGLHACEVSEMAGVGSSYVSKLECRKGEANPQINNLKNIAKVLGVQVEYLVCDDDDAEQIDVILRAYRAMDRRNKDKLLALMEILLS